MRTTSDRIRIYPAACTSAYCGRSRSECPECAHYPELRNFESWKERTRAICHDATWCPNVFEAREGV